MKAFNLVFCLLFILFAVLQYNDPDPWLWIPIYLYTAVLCGLAFRNRFYTRAMLVGIVAYLCYAVYLFFTKDGVVDWVSEHNAENIAESMKATKPWIEDAREFFGLCLLIFALSMNYFYARKKWLA